LAGSGVSHLVIERSGISRIIYADFELERSDRVIGAAVNQVMRIRRIIELGGCRRIKEIVD
jgi:hypothetical protein